MSRSRVNVRAPQSAITTHSNQSFYPRNHAQPRISDQFDLLLKVLDQVVGGQLNCGPNALKMAQTGQVLGSQQSWAASGPLGPRWWALGDLRMRWFGLWGVCLYSWCALPLVMPTSASSHVRYTPARCQGPWSCLCKAPVKPCHAPIKPL